jgi:cupin fold WbuC family metalloprotein
MLNVRIENPEVLYLEDEVVLIKKIDMHELKMLAIKNPRQRIRVCTHRTHGDSLHEMFIVHTKDCYVRPHKHIKKVESMTVLEGWVDMILFNDDASIRSVVSMGTPDSGKTFYHRLSDEIFHMLIIRSEFLVFHEITEGPFLRERTVFPSWAPSDNADEIKKFLERVNDII